MGTDQSSGANQGWRYVVQKHDARRLHYDFRLELDGALVSWAVTRGPSLVPGERRLAVRVEDHRLDYADFEGVIPPGSYGAGTVLVWDQGTWTPLGDPRDGLATGRLAFRLDGERLRGSWTLRRMRGRTGTAQNYAARENWLLAKAADAFARASIDPDVLVEHTTSVLSGRSNEEVAAPGS